MSVERELTLAHAMAVKTLMTREDLGPADVDLVGFHGQTIMHRPHERWTWQIGDGLLLAKELGVSVVNDFRSADVEAGGEGAPFAPLYHAALLKSHDRTRNAKRIAVLNIGGVANVTYVGKDEIVAFDTGPGNGLMNDWVLRHTGAQYDDGGRLAASGRVHDELVREALRNPYFTRAIPKSLDRTDFTTEFVEGLPLEDGAATLAAFTAASVAHSVDSLPGIPEHWYVCGGGRKNPYLMSRLSEELKVLVNPVEVLHWRGDFLEAEAFALLAVRSARGLPLSLPSTTGVPMSMTGGRLSAV